MIQSWKDDALAQVMAGRSPRGFPATVLSSTRRKLFQLDGATRIEDLRSPPGNRLHELTGDRAGQMVDQRQRPVSPVLRLGSERPRKR